MRLTQEDIALIIADLEGVAVAAKYEVERAADPKAKQSAQQVLVNAMTLKLRLRDYRDGGSLSPLSSGSKTRKPNLLKVASQRGV